MKETESQISTMSKCIEDLRNREKNPSHIHQTKPTTSCNHHMADDHNQLGLLHLKRLDTIIYLLQQNPTMPSTPSRNTPWVAVQREESQPTRVLYCQAVQTDGNSEDPTEKSTHTDPKVSGLDGARSGKLSHHQWPSQ